MIHLHPEFIEIPFPLQIEGCQQVSTQAITVFFSGFERVDQCVRLFGLQQFLLVELEDRLFKFMLVTDFVETIVGDNLAKFIA